MKHSPVPRLGFSMSAGLARSTAVGAARVETMTRRRSAANAIRPLKPILSCSIQRGGNQGLNLELEVIFLGP